MCREGAWLGGAEGQDHEDRMSHAGRWPCSAANKQQRRKRGEKGEDPCSFLHTRDAFIFPRSFPSPGDIYANMLRCGQHRPPRFWTQLLPLPPGPRGAAASPACLLVLLSSLETMTHWLSVDLHRDALYISLITTKEAPVSVLPLANCTPLEWSGGMLAAVY